MRRAGHWILSTNRAYRSSSVRRSRLQLEKGCTPGADQRQVTPAQDRLQLGDGRGEVGVRLRRGRAHPGDQLDGRLEQLLVDPGVGPLGVAGPRLCQDLGSRALELVGLVVDEPHLDLHAEGVGRGAGERDRHGLPPAWERVDGAQARATTLLHVVPDPVGSAVAQGGPGHAAVAAGSVGDRAGGRGGPGGRRQRRGRGARSLVRGHGRRAGRVVAGRRRVPDGAPPRRPGARARLLRRHPGPGAAGRGARPALPADGRRVPEHRPDLPRGHGLGGGPRAARGDPRRA